MWGPGTALLLVGINPGRASAAARAHFAGPGNRFWPALAAAGLTDAGWGPSEQGRLVERGVGITNLVARATARADELTIAELRAGGRRLLDSVGLRRPVVVAVLGITAYRRAFDRPDAIRGEQPDQVAGARWWVLDNPSGLNAHARIDQLAAELAAAARAAGLAVAATGAEPSTAGERPRPSAVERSRQQDGPRRSG